MSLPKIGNLAPKFTLKNQDGKKIALKDLVGKNVVLYFYPKALTPGCTVQACDIRDYKKEFSYIFVVGFSSFEETRDFFFGIALVVEKKSSSIK